FHPRQHWDLRRWNHAAWQDVWDEQRDWIGFGAVTAAAVLLLGRRWDHLLRCIDSVKKTQRCRQPEESPEKSAERSACTGRSYERAHQRGRRSHFSHRSRSA